MYWEVPWVWLSALVLHPGFVGLVAVPLVYILHCLLKLVGLFCWSGLDLLTDLRGLGLKPCG